MQRTAAQKEPVSAWLKSKKLKTRRKAVRIHVVGVAEGKIDVGVTRGRLAIGGSNAALARH
jgi:hypothetical protein